MNEIDEALTLQSVLLISLIRTLIAKGVITKMDLLSDLRRHPNETFVSEDVLSALQELVQRIPEH